MATSLKTSAEPIVITTAVGDELVRVSKPDGSGGFNSAQMTTRVLADLSGAVVLSVTLGSAPVALTNIEADIIEITTGGTGTEFLHIADYADSKTSRIGKPVRLVVVSLGDPGDTPIMRYSQNDGTSLQVLECELRDGTPAATSTGTSGIELDPTGAKPFAISWTGKNTTGTGWILDLSATQLFNSDNIIYRNIYPTRDPDEQIQKAFFRDASGVSGTFDNDMGLSNNEALVTTGSAPVALNNRVHEHSLTTGGTGPGEQITLGIPSADDIGQRMAFFLDEIDTAGDTIVLETTNIRNADGSAMTSITFDTLEEFLLLEVYDAAIYRIVRATSGVCNPEVTSPVVLRDFLATGAAAGNITCTGIKPGDRLNSVLRYTAGALVSVLTSEFTITANNTINNAGGTNTTGSSLLMNWTKLTA